MRFFFFGSISKNICALSAFFPLRFDCAIEFDRYTTFCEAFEAAFSRSISIDFNKSTNEHFPNYNQFDGFNTLWFWKGMKKKIQVKVKYFHRIGLVFPIFRNWLKLFKRNLLKWFYSMDFTKVRRLKLMQANLHIFQRQQLIPNHFAFKIVLITREHNKYSLFLPMWIWSVPVYFGVKNCINAFMNKTWNKQKLELIERCVIISCCDLKC